MAHYHRRRIDTREWRQSSNPTPDFEKFELRGKNRMLNTFEKRLGEHCRRTCPACCCPCSNVIFSSFFMHLFIPTWKKTFFFSRFWRVTRSYYYSETTLLFLGRKFRAFKLNENSNFANPCLLSRVFLEILHFFCQRVPATGSTRDEIFFRLFCAGATLLN